MQVPGQELVQAFLAEVGRARGIDARDEVVVGVIAGDLEACLGEDGGQRQPDVSGTHDADLYLLTHVEEAP